MQRVLTWPVAAGSLVIGFGAAELTGVRGIGGAVLVVALAWCYWHWRAAGTARAVLLAVLYAAGFAVSHVLGDILGAWGAVLAVAAVVGAATYWLADRPNGRRRGASATTAPRTPPRSAPG